MNVSDFGGDHSVQSIAQLEERFGVGETIDVLNDSIVSFSEALEVAKEFFDSQELPRSIKWLKL